MMSHGIKLADCRSKDAKTYCGKKGWRCNWTTALDYVTCRDCRAEIAKAAGAV